jgi:hypothetical protein
MAAAELDDLSLDLLARLLPLAHGGQCDTKRDHCS